MLIRWANENDLPAWYALATEVSPVFQHPSDMGSDAEFMAYAQSKVGKYEALTAVDYMSGMNMGFIGFSRTNNRVSWFAVSERYRGKGVGERLLKTTLRQLDTNKDITVTTFVDGYLPGIAARALYKKYWFTIEESATHNGLERSKLTRPASTEKRGRSFHYRYPEFIKASQEEFCPCTTEPESDDKTNDIKKDELFWIRSYYPGQGRLFGKLCVIPLKHHFHFEDMPEDEAAAFMREVQRVGCALRNVTGAVKINYEMHANSGAHLHIHLFPRYLDDDFPSTPIDYRVSKPAPYESYEEYLWFVAHMREELR
jgi:diadenosine tetraphosphate (Ap4A) HIT family hydrolase/ribosomal protein S18 acetylase RimI-like enzyme